MAPESIRKLVGEIIVSSNKNDIIEFEDLLLLLVKLGGKENASDQSIINAVVNFYGSAAKVKKHYQDGYYLTITDPDAAISETPDAVWRSQQQSYRPSSGLKGFFARRRRPH